MKILSLSCLLLVCGIVQGQTKTEKQRQKDEAATILRSLPGGTDNKEYLKAIELKEVATLDGLKIMVQKSVSDGVTFSDWKLEEKKLTVSIQWKEGPANIQWASMKDGKRMAGGYFTTADLVKGKTMKHTWTIADPKRIIVITRIGL